MNLKFITVCPDDTYYTWQVHLWIESLKDLGYSDKATVLIFIPFFRDKNIKWQKIIDLYPEVEFKFYKDEKNEVSNKIGIYIPVIRPYCMKKWMKESPDNEHSTLFYCDSDILFMPSFNLDKFLDDGVNYLSNTNGYINATYFDSKIKDVLPEKLEEYKKIDVLSEATSLVGISREIAEKNNEHSGGAQYLLKNTDYEFWNKVEEDCLKVRIYLSSINKLYFKDESAGFQGWCSDMFCVLWNLWARDMKTMVVKELDFAWSTDNVEKLNTMSILHNAGITQKEMDFPAFYKGAYHRGEDPFKDEHLMRVFNSPESKKKCTHYYVTKLLELHNKYKLEY